MKITLEIGEAELNHYHLKNKVALFPKDTSDFSGFFREELVNLKLTGTKTVGAGWFPNHTLTYESFRVAEKTKEEIAAEESVAKAKEALLAAENALKTIKEKK